MKIMKRSDGSEKSQSVPSLNMFRDGMVLLALLGLMISAIGSTFVQLYRNNYPDDETTSWLSSFPEFTFVQSMSMMLLVIGLLFIFIKHMELQLRLVSLGMPIIESALPLLGHGLLFIFETPWDCMLKWHRHYGEIFAYTLMGRTMVSLSSSACGTS